MAMIPCPSCGEMISDKSPKCIHCGYKFTPQTKTCPECGAELDQTATVCPKCGCPVSSESSDSAPIEVTVSQNAKKNFTKVAIAIAALENMEDSSFLSVATCVHREHFCPPSTSPQNWGHPS